MDNIDISFGDDVLLGHGKGVIIDDHNDNVISSETVVGPPGPPGPPGYSPTANVTQTEDGAIIRITDAGGTTTANVYNGVDGISPSATVTNTGSGATITITDANGTTTATVNNGEDGEPGDNATIAIGQTTTLAPGSQATVTNVGTATNAVLDFGIPEGLQGEQGVQGDPGINAVAYVTQNTGSATITIEDADGITTATVYDGQDGTNGTDGISPVATVTPTASGATISITDAQGTTTANITNGADGTDGTDGVTPVISATASVDNTTGTPAVTVSKSGTDANPSFAFAFEHLKGDSGVTPTPTSVAISSYITMRSGYSNVYSYAYKFGKLMIVQLLVKSNSNFTSSQVKVGDIASAYYPANAINYSCSLGTDEWSTKGVGYLYMSSVNGEITIADYNNSGCKCAKINLAYIIN